MDEKKIFKHETKSLDELSVLLALGAEVKQVDRNSDSRFYKFFLETDKFDMEKTTLALASKTLTVNAYDLLEAGRRAKSIIHAR